MSHGADRGSVALLKQNILYSELKYDPPRRLSEIRILDLRLRVMMFITLNGRNLSSS